MNAAPDSEVFMARVEALLNHQGASLPSSEAPTPSSRDLGPPLSPLAAGVLVGVAMGIADSRSFATLLAIEHALVLREVAELSGPDGLLVVTGRHPKSMRTALALSARGSRLLEACKNLNPNGNTCLNVAAAATA